MAQPPSSANNTGRECSSQGNTESFPMTIFKVSSEAEGTGFWSRIFLQGFFFFSLAVISKHFLHQVFLIMSTPLQVFSFCF